MSESADHVSLYTPIYIDRVPVHIGLALLELYRGITA
jgi:hypothetical protein